MLTFEGHSEDDRWRFVHNDGKVIVEPFPALGHTTVIHATLFEGTRQECIDEYNRLGLTDADAEE